MPSDIFGIEGRAGERLVDVGNVITANQSNLLVIQRVDPIYADFTEPVSELIRLLELERGQPR